MGQMEWSLDDIAHPQRAQPGTARQGPAQLPLLALQGRRHRRHGASPHLWGDGLPRGQPLAAQPPVEPLVQLHADPAVGSNRRQVGPAKGVVAGKPGPHLGVKAIADGADALGPGLRIYGGYDVYFTLFSLSRPVQIT